MAVIVTVLLVFGQVAFDEGNGSDCWANSTYEPWTGGPTKTEEIPVPYH